MKTSYNSTCLLRVLIQWTEQFFSHKLVRPCGAVLADRCFCLSTCWLAFHFCCPLCCHTESRSAAAMLNPNQGKEQFVQTTFRPPPPSTLYSCNSLSSAALNKASWDPTSREIRAEACSCSVGLKGVGGGGEVTCFLQDCSTFWDRIFAALFLTAKDLCTICFLL